jgi:hypothetical protein
MDPESLKTLKGLCHLVDARRFSKLAKRIAPDISKSELLRRIAGLEEEDAFAAICALMGTAKQLVRFDQRPFITSNQIAVDFYARFVPPCAPNPRKSMIPPTFRCLIEVKSTAKDRFRVGGAWLKRRREFAKELGLPLVFAVRFTHVKNRPFWVLKEATSDSSLEFLQSDIDKNLRTILFDDYNLCIKPDTEFSLIWNKDGNATGPYHPEFGGLQEIQLKTKDKIKTWIGLDGMMVSLVTSVFSGKRRKLTFSGNLVHETFLPSWIVPSLSDMLWHMYALVQAPESQNGQIKISLPLSLDLRFCAETTISELVNSGFLARWGEPDLHIAQWKDLRKRPHPKWPPA